MDESEDRGKSLLIGDGITIAFANLEIKYLTTTTKTCTLFIRNPESETNFLSISPPPATLKLIKTSKLKQNIFTKPILLFWKENENISLI